jgi:hypothetical protein
MRPAVFTGVAAVAPPSTAQVAAATAGFRTLMVTTSFPKI